MNRVPSDETAARVRRLIMARGDRFVASKLNLARGTVSRIAAALPVLDAVLVVAETRLPGIEALPNDAA